MRCASYTRTVSCLRETEIPNNIISQQNQRIQEFIKKKEWSLVKKYSDRKKDELEESAFLQMKQDAIGRQFDCLVMDSIFRCGKNTNVAVELLKNVFLPAGIYFAVVEDGFCSSEVSIDQATKYLQEKIKEYRSHTVNKDMRKYTETKQFPKYGYRYKGTEMELEIDPEAAANVKKIFQLVSEGNSFKKTAEIMTEAAVMSSGKYVDKLWGRTVKNPEEPWKKDQIKRIIYNRLYLGEWIRTINGKKCMVSCPAIIDKELFDKANNRRSQKVDKSNLGKTPMNPFAKMIFDKETGIPLKIHTQQRLKIQVFRRSYAEKEKTTCRKGNIPYVDVYDGVYELLLKEKRRAERLLKMIATSEWEYEKQRQLQKVRASAQDSFAKMMEIENENYQLYSQFVNGSISSEEYECCKQQNINLFEEEDCLFQQDMEQIEKIEKCFSADNPWIRLFAEADIPEKLEREHIKKWIERIEVVYFEYVEVCVKYREWKERFPKQWLEESYGTKKQKDTSC